MLSLKSKIGWLVCLAVIFAWFSPWWFGGKNLAPLDLQNQMMSPWRDGNESQFAKNHIVSDAVDQYLVYRMVAAENFRKEGWLGWSTLTYGGTAQYANTMALYDDWTMQLHRWFKFWTAWHLGLMGQVMLAATGMFLFLRGRSISQIWACCGALAYAGNSQFVTWIYHRWSLGAFCWAPWILWAIDAYRKGNKSFWPIVPCMIALGFLGGTLQHAGLLVVGVGAVWLEEALGNKRQWVPQMKLLARYAAWGILGVGLAAMMFLPCIAAFLESNRLGLHTGMHGRDTSSFYQEGTLQPLFHLLSYPFHIFPSLLGRCDSLDLLKLFKSELFYVAYFGSVPVLIAFLALGRKQSPLLARLLIGMGLLLPLTPLVRVLYQRLFLLFILGGILAFTHFMQSASRETRLKVVKMFGGCLGLGMLAWASLSFLLHAKPQILESLQAKLILQAKGSSFGYFDEWIVQRVQNFAGDLFIWSSHQALPLTLLLIALLGLFFSASRSLKHRSVGNWILALSVIGEVSLFASRWVVFTDPKDFPLFPITQEVTALKEHLGPEGRVTTLIHPSAHMARTPFIPNTLSAYGIASISGYDSIIPDGMVLPIESPGDARKLGRFGVSHLITYPENKDVTQDWTLAWESKSMALYRNTQAFPRYMGFKNDSEQAVFFTGKERVEFTPLTERSHLENTREIEIPSGIRWIRIAENHAPGWEFRINDAKWQPVRRGPDASMLLPIDAPNASTGAGAAVSLRYAPPLRRMGFWISGTCLIITLAIATFFGWNRARQNSAIRESKQGNAFEFS